MNTDKCLTKEQLISQLENAKNNYIISLAAISLLSSKKSLELLHESNVNFGKYVVNFSQITNMFLNSKDKEIAVKEFLKSNIRALIKESFELVKSYCKDNDQMSILESQDWFQFSRLIRNAISHNYKFSFSSFDRRILPVLWNNRIINEHMNNKYLELDLLGYDGFWELFLEFERFVHHKL